MKTIKLISTQVAEYWEVIKFGATTADEVDPKDLQPYLVELLHALLSDKAQCWMRLDESRTVIAILITRIIEDKITTDRHLYLQCVFSYREIPIDAWKSDFALLVQFAKQENCRKIKFDSRYPKIWEMAKYFGCREAHRSFTYGLE